MGLSNAFGGRKGRAGLLNPLLPCCELRACIFHSNLEVSEKQLAVQPELLRRAERWKGRSHLGGESPNRPHTGTKSP